MKHFLGFAMLLFVSAVGAQADPLLPGLYQAESDLLLPYYTGAGWTQVVDGDYSVMETATAEDSVSFVVSGGQLVIYRELLAIDGATAEICVDELCTTFTSISSEDQKSVPIAYPVEDESVVTITLETGTLRLDSFLLLAADELVEVTAPDPARRYVTLPDGTIAAIVQEFRGGDDAFLAIGVAQVALLLLILGVALWKR